MFNRRSHYSLRFERGYSVFVLLTDPVRMLFFLGLFASPSYFAFVYLLYLPLELVAWLRLGRQDPIYMWRSWPPCTTCSSWWRGSGPTSAGSG